MKRTAMRLISILLVTVMCFSVLPIEVFAWGKMTHTYTANMIVDDLFNTGAGSSSVKYEGKDYNFAIPEEFLEAIEAYPDAFRAGALGPDMYPDILTGQMYIHPEDPNIDSGEWITYLVDSANKLAKNTEGRKVTLAFVLGCIFHYCGDLFGHDFVNTFAGGTFPSVASFEMLDLKGERLNKVLSHMAVEKYMDSLIYRNGYDPEKYGTIDAPEQFIANVMIFNGTPASGLAPLYQKYPSLGLDEIDTGDIFIVSDLLDDILDVLFADGSNNVPPHYSAMRGLRRYVTGVADDYRENMEVVSAAITRYCDEWAADIDRGIQAFAQASDNIARRMITKEKNPAIEKKKQEELDSDKNKIILSMEKQFEEAAKSHGYTQEQLDKIKEASTLGIDGDSFFDEILRELIRKGVVTQEMVTSNGGSLTIIKEELSYWWDEYGVYMLGIPDIMIDGIPEIPLIGDIIDLLLLGPLWDLIKLKIKEWAAEEIVSACTGLVTLATGLEGKEAADEINEFVSKINDRLENPELQLNHEDNPFQPSEDNFADLQEFMKYLRGSTIPTQMNDTEFEALYNTLVMFKLVLMGPDNYSKFIRENADIKQTAYQTNTAHIGASALTVRIRTAKMYLSGTNDNIYVIVYRKGQNGSKTQLACKLLDKSGYDDFEAGHQDDYLVELPVFVPLDEIEIALRKTPAFDFIPSMTDDWRCENIQIIPMFSGYEQTAPIDLGGIHLKGICGSVGMAFQEALKVKHSENVKSQTVTNLQVEIKVSGENWSGSDSDIYVVAYNGDKQWARVCLDKKLDNDLEMGETERYNIPITKYAGGRQGIPLDKLRIEIEHTGSDQAIWDDLKITPCYGSLKLTAPIDFSGVRFENITWDIDFQRMLKKATYRDQNPDLSQMVDNVKVQVIVSAELYAGTDSDVSVEISGRDYLGGAFALDRDLYNDLEMGDSDTYYCNLSKEIPLDQLDFGFSHMGNDESFWAEVLVTPCKGTKELTDPISLGGKKIEDDFWRPDFQYSLKMHYAPIEIEYETILDDGLLSYMGSLDAGEEWVDVDNELWTNPKLRTEIFFKIFKGFTPEIEYVGDRAFALDKPAEFDLDFTGEWNGVSMERRSQVEDFDIKSPVEGSATVEVINEKGKVVYTAKNVELKKEKISVSVPASKLESGEYDVKVSYLPSTAIPMYGAKEVTFEKAFKYGGLGIKTQPKDAAVNLKEEATFTVEVVGGKTPYTYTWQRKNQNGDWDNLGNNANTLKTTPLTYDERQLRCVIRDANGDSVTSDAAMLTVKAPELEKLTVYRQPKDATVMPGEEATLEVQVTGGHVPYTYSWKIVKIENQAVPRPVANPHLGTHSNTGSNTDTIKYSANATQDVKIQCEITDAQGTTVTSEVATVRIKGTPFSIKTQPKDVTVAVGEKTTLTVEVTGGKAPYTYVWQVPSSRATSWIDIQNGSSYTGQGTNTLTYTAKTAGVQEIRCQITDANGEITVTSNTAKVTKTDVLSIKTQPKDVTVETGKKGILTVEAVGGKAPYTYTWQMQSGNTWVDASNSSMFSGQGTNSFGVLMDMTGSVRARCVVKDANGKTVTSNEATVTITEPLKITTQPKDVTVDVGEKATLTVEATGGKAPYTYTWQMPATRGASWIDIQNGSTYSGQGTNKLTYTSNTAGAQEIRCKITDANGVTVTSNTAKVTKTDVLSIKTQPKDVTVETGKKGILTVEAVGGKAPYTYTWQMQSGNTWVNASNSSMFSGQGTNSFTVLMDIAGSVRARCVVKDTNGKTVTSNEATVTITEPLKIKTQPKNVTVDVGKQATLTVAVSGGTTPYTYNWRVNADGRIWLDIQNGSGYAGQGTNTLTYTPNLAGTYTIQCVIKDANGNSVTSNTVTVTVKAKADPIIITTQPEDVTVATNEQTTLTVKAAGGKEPYVYTWQQYSRTGGWTDVKGGGQLLGPQYLGQGTNSLRVTSNIEGTIRLRCVVLDLSGNSVTSNEVTVTVTKAADPLSITTQPKNTTVSVGENAFIQVEVAGGTEPYTYTWQRLHNNSWTDTKLSVEYFSQDTNLLICAPLAAGVTYLRCVIKDANGNEVISDIVTLTVNPMVEPLVITMQPVDAQVDVGSNTGVYVEVSGGKAPYTYTWQILNGNNWGMFRESSQFFGQGTDTLVYAPIKAGSVTVRCIIKDSTGKTVTSNSATITAIVKPLAVQINNGAEKYTLSYLKGETVVLNANVTGGVGPYTYTWYEEGFDETTLSYDWIPVHTELSYKVGPGYSHEIRLEVKDAEGNIVKATVWIEVIDQIN